MSVSKKTAKKIGLITSISILVGSVVGIGIFFKNGSVFAANNNNAIGVLISWILAAIIALTTAYSFAEIGSSDRGKTGLAGWASKMLGYKIGRFIKIVQPLFYYGILDLVVGIFSVEAILNVFDAADKVNIVGIIALGFLIIGISMTFNYISFKASGYFQIVATSLKFIPLLAVGIAGIIFGVQHPNASLFNNHKESGSLSVTSILASLPAILFAFDSFLCVGNLSGEMKNPHKNIPITIIFGMIICAMFYLFVTIGQIESGSDSAYKVFETIGSGQAGKIFISVFIMISILGVLNSLCAAALRSFQSLIDEELVFKHELFRSLGSGRELKPGLILGMLVFLFWSIIMIIPSAISNNDYYIDGISNFPTLFFFAVYGSVVLGCFINRFTKKVKVDKMPGFIIIAPIAVIGCYLAFGYQFFYAFSIDAIIHPTKIVSWGLFANHGEPKVEQWQAAIVFFTMLIAFITIPFINDTLIKLGSKKTPDGSIMQSLLV